MDEHNKFAYNCIKHGRIGKMEKKRNGTKKCKQTFWSQLKLIIASGSL